MLSLRDENFRPPGTPIRSRKFVFELNAKLSLYRSKPGRLAYVGKASRLTLFFSGALWKQNLARSLTLADAQPEPVAKCPGETVRSWPGTKCLESTTPRRPSRRVRCVGISQARSMARRTTSGYQLIPEKWVNRPGLLGFSERAKRDALRTSPGPG
jgi:hypothetical protein